MPQTITLKNAAGADVVFNLRSVDARGKQTLISAGATLLEAKKLELSVVEHANTFRIIGKLSVPSASSCAGGCTTPAYTEVGSFDLSSVKVASESAQADFLALFSSFVGSDEVESSYTTGV